MKPQPSSTRKSTYPNLKANLLMTLLVLGVPIGAKLILLNARAEPAVSPRIESAGSLNVPRTEHSAARLSDGRVVIWGGRDTNGFAAQPAEIYDPQTRTWSIYTDPEPAPVPLREAGPDYATAIELANTLTLFFGSNGVGLLPPGSATVTNIDVPELLRDAATATELMHEVRDADGNITEIADYNKKILVAGGHRPVPNAQNGEVEIFPDAVLYNPSQAQTDKRDYQPGDHVLLSGSGWKPGESVDIYVVDDAATNPEWYYDTTATADQDGNFIVTPYLFEVLLQHLGVTFNLSAVGAQSGLIAKVEFTDSVTVTAASGGTNISADKAANATSPQYTTLGDIVISEPGNGKQDIAASQSNKTLILTAPSGWNFNAGVGSVSFQTGRDITSASIAVTSTTITVTLSTGSGSNGDTLTISGIQVRATNGSALPSAGNILRTAANSGTATITGITNDVTNFGSLSQVVGAPASIVFTTAAQTIERTATSGTISILIRDQFANTVTTSQTVTLSSSSGGGSFRDTADTTTITSVATSTGSASFKYRDNNTGTPTLTAAIGSVSGTQVETVQDTVAPTVSSINRTGTTPANASSVQFTVTFSESVTGVDSGDFALATTGISGASISTVTGSGSTRTVTVNTGSGDGTIGLNLVDNDSIVDGGGNPLAGNGAGNGNFTGQTYTIDKTAPGVVSIVRADANPSNAGSVHFTVTFSESVTGVDAGDFALASTGVSGASISTSLSGSGATYTVTVNTGSGSGAIGLNLVDNDSIVDSAGNPLGGSGAGNGNLTGEVYAIDKNRPNVTANQAAGQGDPTNTVPVHFTIAFDEVVTDFAAGDVTLSGTATGKSLSSVTDSGDHMSYDVAVTATGGGTIVLTLGQNVAHDAAGNGNTASSNGDNSVTYDITAPAVTSINRQNPTQQTVNATTVTFRVDFSESVSGVDINDFMLTTGGTATGTISSVSASSGDPIDVTITSVAGNGTLRLDLKSSGTGITDLAGNAISGGFTGGQTYIIDNTPPAAPTTLDMTAATDTGCSSTDNVTTDNTPTFTGTAEAGSTVKIYREGNILVGTDTAANYNSPGITTSALSPGAHSITATATDATGNESAPSAPLTVIIGNAITMTSIGTASVQSSGGTTLINGVTATGGTIIIAFAMDDPSGTTASFTAVSATDNGSGGSNNYNVDADVSNNPDSSTAADGVRTVILSAWDPLESTCRHASLSIL